jgi:hypothetical protein
MLVRFHLHSKKIEIPKKEEDERLRGAPHANTTY